MKADLFGEKPHEDLVQCETHNSDEGEYAEFGNPVFEPVNSEDPRDAQEVVGHDAEGERQGGRREIMDAQEPGHQEKC